MLGLGLGAFVDGVVLHQLLQWHHLVSSRTPVESQDALETNTVADGLLHAGAWLLVVAALPLLVAAWRSGRPAPAVRVVVGALLTGWGAFNVLDGVLNHWLLEVHHVRDDLGGPLSWDVGFLVVALGQVVAGLLLLRERASAREVGVAPPPHP